MTQRHPKYLQTVVTLLRNGVLAFFATRTNLLAIYTDNSCHIELNDIRHKQRMHSQINCITAAGAS